VTSIRLGALDFFPIPPSMSSSDVIWQAIELVPQLEAWGYTRYWLGEHHGAGIAHSSPEILIPVLAGLTSSIRIGAGGILLSLHRPTKVAEDFRLLNLLYPGRIDLGLARGSKSHEQVALSSLPNQPYVSYEDKVSELLGYLRNSNPLVVNPNNVWPPELWMLGSSTVSVRLASIFSTFFCFAEFLSAEGIDLSEIAAGYFSHFQPSIDIPAPRCAIALAGVCAESESEAERLVQVERSIAVRPTLVGSPSGCARRLHELERLTGINEFFFLDLCQNPRLHQASFRLLAQAVL
jgi:luciferase family oxidoreductase group 1